MHHLPTSSTRKVRRLAAGAAVLVAGLATSCVVAPPSTPAPACGTTATSVTATAPAGGTLTITPKSNLCQVDQVVTVTGSGWSTTANGGLGIYVAFGPTMANYWSNAGALPVAKWIHPGATPSAGQDVLNADGTFSTTITVDAQFTTSDGAYDCLSGGCQVYTMTAHGLPDRTQDTASTVKFHK